MALMQKDTEIKFKYTFNVNNNYISHGAAVGDGWAMATDTPVLILAGITSQ